MLRRVRLFSLLNAWIIIIHVRHSSHLLYLPIYRSMLDAVSILPIERA